MDIKIRFTQAELDALARAEMAKRGVHPLDGGLKVLYGDPGTAIRHDEEVVFEYSGQLPNDHHHVHVNVYIRMHYDFPLDRKIMMIKELRQCVGYGLKEAKDLVDMVYMNSKKLPYQDRIYYRVTSRTLPQVEAEKLVEVLKEIGGIDCSIIKPPDNGPAPAYI